jgi:uncharacterized protein (DUF305 family)
MMIPHHEQALEMARLADGRASDPAVKDLAARIEQAQEPEIATLGGWLAAWGRPAATESASGAHHGGGQPHRMEGMLSEEEMDQLAALKGNAFDEAFARMMIEHHDGAVSMAEQEQREGLNAEAVELAGEIVTAQTAEIEELRDVIDRP